MGAVIIGIGVAVAAIGLLLGAIGFGSAETTSGAALFTVGSIVFVGGLLLMGLGFIQRAVVDVANKLDGVLHYEPDEDVVHRAKDELSTDVSLATGAESATGVVIAPPPAVRLDPIPGPRTTALSGEAVLVRLDPVPEPEPVVDPMPEAAPVEEKTKPAGRGLPSWFRRKAEPEAAPEPAEETMLDEVPDAPAPEVPAPEPVTSERLRREVPSFLREGFARSATSEAPFEPRSRLEPTPPPAPEPEPEEPSFLSAEDLLAEPEEEALPPPVLLKSGVIGGMAYKLYSDGSIEADLPDGTLRFASLQELRDHVAASAARSEG